MDPFYTVIIIHVFVLLLPLLWLRYNFVKNHAKLIVPIQMAYFIIIGAIGLNFLIFSENYEGLYFIFLVPFSLAAYWLLSIAIIIWGNYIRTKTEDILFDILMSSMPLILAISSFIFLSHLPGKIGG